MSSLINNKKTLPQKIKVIVSRKVLNQFKYLCKEIPHVEWSGPLFYTIEGSITKPNSLIITLQEIYPIDKGSSGFTSYSIGLPVAKFMNQNGAIDNGWKIGHIHSHNSMGVFFSGTDMSELTGNAENHNFYLSVIVNNKSEILGKVGIMSKSNTAEVDLEETGFVAMDENGDDYIIESIQALPEKKFFEYDCEFHYEEDLEVSDEFKEIMSKMVEHQHANREFPSNSSSTRSNKWWDQDDEESTGFQYSNKNKVVPHTGSNILPSSHIDEDVEELAYQLMIDGDENAASISTVEDIIDYYSLMDFDGLEIAENILKVYDEKFKEVYKNKSLTTPKLYVLRTLIASYKESYSKGNVVHSAFMDPIVEKLEAKLRAMSSISNNNRLNA